MAKRDSRAFTIVPVDGLAASDRRGIAFLVANDESLNGQAVFARLPVKQERDLRARFDYWIGNGVRDNYFHGWPNQPEHRHCFVFKWNQGRLHHRLYGFLCHPQPQTRPRFQVCVLALHTTKTARETDPSILATLASLIGSPDVKVALAEAFSDDRGGAARWVH